MQIPYKERLVVVGESFPHKKDFKNLKDKLMGSTGKRGCDFSQLDIGEALNKNIYNWFQDEENQKLWEQFKTK